MNNFKNIAVNDGYTDFSDSDVRKSPDLMSIVSTAIYAYQLSKLTGQINDEGGILFVKCDASHKSVLGYEVRGVSAELLDEIRTVNDN